MAATSTAKCEIALWHTHAHARTLWHTHAHAHTHARVHTHAHTRTHARTHTRTHARTHTHTHMHTYTHTHAHHCHGKLNLWRGSDPGITIKSCAWTAPWSRRTRDGPQAR